MEFGDLAILGTNEVGSVACDLAAGRCQLQAVQPRARGRPLQASSLQAARQRKSR
jgi:hypothetical protein